MENLIFKDLEISKEILRAIDAMGFEEATPIQTQGIPPILAGKDIIGQAPTGTGKTCAFGIPVIEHIDPKKETVQALILCPTRELAIQMTEELQKVAQFKTGIKILPVYGGQAIDRQIMGLRRHPQIIVATPGRMMDHLRRGTVSIDHLTTVVLDEADEMLNMGFREDIDIILETVPKNKQMILFSATMPKEIIDIAKKYQHDAVLVKVTHKEITIPTITQYYVEIRGKTKVDVLSRLIEHNGYKLCLVFCNTKRMVDELTEDLAARGYSVEALHGDMRQAQRDKVMGRFKKGQVEILVATDVAARGLDIDDIEAVFNYDIPSDEEYYVHRVGRTGRANKTGISYTFVIGKEIYKLRDIMRYTNAKIDPIKIPTLSDMEQIKVKNVYNTVKETLSAGQLDKYISYIETFIEEDENSELTPLEVAAAFLKQVMNIDAGKNKLEEIPQGPSYSRESGAETGMSRLFLNIGRIDKLEPRHIVKMIASNCDMSGKDIGAVSICDTFSFVEVPIADSEKVITTLNTLKFNTRKINAERAVKKPR